MKPEINWDIAPEGATHHGAGNNPNIIAWYRYTPATSTSRHSWAFKYTEDGRPCTSEWSEIPDGGVPLQLPLTPRPTFVAPPIIVVKHDWTPGVDLPPVGTKCLIAHDMLANINSLYKELDGEAGLGR